MHGVVGFVEANNPSELTVVVVCYTGMTAAHAVVALRLAGHDARVLKFGMSSWNSDFDSWSGNVGNEALAQPDGWNEDAAVPQRPVFGAPVLDTGQTSGEAILQAQITVLLAGGLRGVSAADVLADPTGYNVLNYWGEADWAQYGHVTGAYLVPPGTLSVDSGLDTVDPDAPNVIYCWTGQTASLIAAYLTVLGYEAYALKFGTNALIYDDLQGGKWSTTTSCYEYAYDTGP